MSKQKLIPPPPSIDLLMHSLKHHAPDNMYAVCKNPFEEINACEELAKTQNVLDYDSEPDSEIEDALYNSQWGDADQEFGDVQSLDQEMEYSEIVDRAGVYTGEEILKVSIEKATKLHSLYCSQLSELRQIYIERKRQYLQELKKEKELYCSIHKQKKTSLEEMRKYQQLKALMAYGRKHRLDAILAKREHEKRMSSSSRTPNKAQKAFKCAFQDDGVRCIATCVPLTKFCIRHILMDKRQVLFRPCGAPFNNTTCNNPVLVSQKDEHCVFHATFKAALEREMLEKAAKEETKEKVNEDSKEEEKIDVDSVEEETSVKAENKEANDEKVDVEGNSEVVERQEEQINEVTEQTLDEQTNKMIEVENNEMLVEGQIDQVIEESQVVEEQIESEIVEETQVVEEEIEYEEDKIMVEETVQEEVVEDHIVDIE